MASAVEAGTAGGVPDLLLVDPPLGVLPGDVEPYRHRVRPDPPHGRPGGVEVEPGDVGLEPAAGHVQQVGEDPGAEQPGGLDPLLVEPVEPGRQVGARRRIDAVPVSAPRHIAELDADQLSLELRLGDQD